MHARFSALIGAAVAICAASAGSLAAQSAGPVVVELYTAQGCAACPPADAYFAELAGRDDLIALALHVDYWDYLGWADPFARPGHTARQKSYARAIGAKMIYTPQLIIEGEERIEGLQTAVIDEQIARHGAEAGPVTLRLERAGKMVRIAADTAAPLARALMVQMVRYRPAETMTIERGENAGHTATYHNIVTQWDALGEWTGEAPLSIEARAEGEDPVVVILQEPGPGPIVAAARLR